MKKILVTGAGGYIGSVATCILLQNRYTVVALDNFSTGYREPLNLLQEKFGNEKLSVYKADLTKNIDDIFQKEKDVDAVLHYAASCVVDESMKNPEKYFFNNVYGSQNLLTSMMKFGIYQIIFSSTCAVYGEGQYMPMDEKHPIASTTPYGASKRIVEELIEWYGKLKKLHYVILRYFNVCGASDDGLIGDSKKPSTLLVQNTVRGALNIEPFLLTCPNVDTPDKTPIRDYVNVVDLNEAHLKALEYLSNGGKNEIINLGTGSGNSVLEIVNQVQAITGVKFPLKKTSPREGDDAKKIASINKAKSVLGWEPKRTIKDSVTSLVKWYKNHPEGWNS
ncbi:UDP-glucose 4-epimerase GalE [Candidatus Roizmanbacteria bacterium]|nr:UDP-glucose 4-epimerase GalE [Candidatus Roizmanbacteria bacterium]